MLEHERVKKLTRVLNLLNPLDMVAAGEMVTLPGLVTLEGRLGSVRGAYASYFLIAGSSTPFEITQVMTGSYIDFSIPMSNGVIVVHRAIQFSWDAPTDRDRIGYFTLQIQAHRPGERYNTIVPHVFRLWPETYHGSCLIPLTVPPSPGFPSAYNPVAAAESNSVDGLVTVANVRISANTNMTFAVAFCGNQHPELNHVIERSRYLQGEFGVRDYYTNRPDFFGGGR